MENATGMAAASASAISTAYFSPSAGLSLPRQIRRSSESPARYSIAMKSTPSCWPMS